MLCYNENIVNVRDGFKTEVSSNIVNVQMDLNRGKFILVFGLFFKNNLFFH